MTNILSFTDERIFKKMNDIITLMNGLEGHEAQTAMIGAAIEIAIQAGLSEENFVKGVTLQARDWYNLHRQEGEDV